VEPKFIDLQKMTHVSLEDTVELALRSLPLLVSAVSPVDFKDPDLTLLRDECRPFRTIRSYIIIEAKLRYISEIVYTSVDSARVNFQKPRLVVHVIIDNDDAPGNTRVLSLTKDQRLRRFGFRRTQHTPDKQWMPPHSKVLL
jgi:hypothetical protein